MKLLMFFIVLFVNFEINSQTIKPSKDYHFGFDYTSKISNEKFDKIKSESLKSYSKFKLKSRLVNKLKNGKSVQQSKFYGKRRFLRKINQDSSDLNIIIPNVDFVQIFKNPKLRFYYLIDEKIGYIQMVAMDTNDLGKIQFLSGHISKQVYRDFKSFNQSLHLIYSRQDSLRIKDEIWFYKTPLDKGEKVNLDSVKQFVYMSFKQNLWMSIINLPICGPNKDIIYNRNISKLYQYKRLETNILPPFNNLYLMDSSVLINEILSLKRTYRNPVKPVDSKYVYVIFNTYFSKNLNAIKEYNNKLPRKKDSSFVKLFQLPSFIPDTMSINTLTNLVYDTLKKNNCDEKDLLISNFYKGYKVNGSQFYIKEIENDFLQINVWCYCYYLCPYTFVLTEKDGIFLQYESVFDTETGINSIRLIKEVYYPLVAKELIKVNY